MSVKARHILARPCNEDGSEEGGQMSENDIVAAVYDLRAGAEEAAKDLQKYGFDMKNMSIVAENARAEEHVVGGASASGGGLYSIGLPKDSVLIYEVAIKADRFLLLVHGTGDETGRAREILMGTHPAELHTHSAEQTLAPALVAK
jgi:hypothetical protein